MKKLTTIALIVVAALAVTIFASGGPGCCFIPQASAAPAPRAAVTTFHIDGMTCGSCATAVRQVLKKVDGVKDARVSYEEKKAVVTYDPAKVTSEKIARTVSEKLPTYKATVVK
jgi:copper chaperone